MPPKQVSNATPIVWTQTLNTYLGQKGYTIPKNELTPVQLADLQKLLTIQPRIFGAPPGSIPAFAAYRISPQKIYIPRFFGESLFGPPKQVKLPPGDDIQVTFDGSLRDYQIPVVDAFLQKGGTGLLDLYCGAGKTSVGIYLACVLKKKTLIVVGKEFLMNQWIERIQQFAPSARIGKLQGQIVDIEHKDFVLCMLQSLYAKDYPSSLFDSFGFTIYDEVHHLAAESFSNALFKVVTPHCLGLSATMDRKDGTSHVFKMFLGDIVYTLKRKQDDMVMVYGLTYECDDAEFNEVLLDFRGQTASSKMLSKISEYNMRSEFILSVLRDVLASNPKQQIMMIASYKNILKYMHDAIVHRNIGTVGYYVGGMKEAALKQSEEKQVILATYAMAAEGLDIKTLTTLFMLTPMTSIEQSVGRILRTKHDFYPSVYDFIDTHDNYQRQWMKRRAFYKSQGYMISQIGSKQYTPDTSKWRKTFIPKNATTTTLCSHDEDEGEGETNKTPSVCLLPCKKAVV